MTTETCGKCPTCSFTFRERRYAPGWSAYGSPPLRVPVRVTAVARWPSGPSRRLRDARCSVCGTPLERTADALVKRRRILPPPTFAHNRESGSHDY